MKDIIDQMRESDSIWYKEFFADSLWVKEHANEIHPVRYKDKDSKNSFAFGRSQPQSQDDAFSSLSSVFPFLQGEGIEEKYRDATNGNGHEWNRITRLHSSSLLSFLLFCQVSEAKPLEIWIDGRMIKFQFARFEVKNWLEFNDSFPSNIDVVLENDDCILFLESKFT